MHPLLLSGLARSHLQLIRFARLFGLSVVPSLPIFLIQLLLPPIGLTFDSLNKILLHCSILLHPSFFLLPLSVIYSTVSVLLGSTRHKWFTRCLQMHVMQPVRYGG